MARFADETRHSEGPGRAREDKQGQTIQLVELRQPGAAVEKQPHTDRFAGPAGGMPATQPAESDPKPGSTATAVLDPSDGAGTASFDGQPIAIPNPTYANLGGSNSDQTRAVQLEGEALVRTIHERLSVVGCYTKRSEASWNQDSIDALKRFYHFAEVDERTKVGVQRSLKLAATQPDLSVLDDLNRFDHQICPMVCPAGSEEHGGVCVTVTCPSGFQLKRGVCAPLPTAERPGSRKAKAREPEAREQAERPPQTPRVKHAAPAPAAPHQAQAKKPAPKPVMRVVDPVRLRPRVAPLARTTPAQPARATASVGSDFGPAHIGAIRAMTRMP